MSKKNLHPVSLGPAEKHEVDTALSIYADQLLKKANEAEKLGKQPVADAWRAEAKAINQVEGDGPGRGLRARITQRGTPELMGAELPICRCALQIYITRLRAVAGSLKGVAEQAMADELETKATTVEERVLQIFDEQVQMHLEVADQATPTPRTVPAGKVPETITRLADELYAQGYDVPTDALLARAEQDRADASEWAHAVATDAEYVPPLPAWLEAYRSDPYTAEDALENEIQHNEAEAAQRTQAVDDGQPLDKPKRRKGPRSIKGTKGKGTRGGKRKGGRGRDR